MSKKVSLGGSLAKDCKEVIFENELDEVVGGGPSPVKGQQTSTSNTTPNGTSFDAD
ncbi:hypothetical protein QE368_002993 [Asaia bogorensis NBRC 16594]|nr:hypothetical protein [Asaia bogorensis NBRC 16594]